MLKNYFKTALRNLIHHRFFTVLNILGLSTSLACTILILLWVHNELSYDRFHKNGDHIYRIAATTMGQAFPLTGAPLAAALKAQIPGIKNTARLRPNYGESTIFTVEENPAGEKQAGAQPAAPRQFEEKGAFYADPGFLQVFSFPLVNGDANTALVRPDGILVTERIAKKYFGTDNAIGKTIRMNNKDAFTVTGILKDPPANSHLQFDILLPMSFDARTDQDIIDHHYDNLNFYTYLQFDDNKDITPAAMTAMEHQIGTINHQGEPTFTADFQLQALSKIHLYSKFLYDVDGQGNIAYVRIFSIVAFFILLVACINFMNLATARSARRAREVGLRKVIGARRIQLIGQFLGESFLITFFSLLLGIILVIIVLPVFNQVLGKSLALRVTDGWFLPGLLLIFAVTGVISGSYPAFFLSAFRPIKVLKGRLTTTRGGHRFFRNGLVVFQFVVSIVLIVGTTVVYRQLRFIRDRDLGYDKQHLLYLPLKGELGPKLDVLSTALKSSPHLNNFSVVSELPVNAGMGTAGVQWEGKTPNTHPMFSVMGIDDHFFEVFKMHLNAGRAFSTDFKADTMNYIVNEKALQVLGWNTASAIGKPLTVWGNKGRIIGVVKDFNFKPVQSAVDPLILRFNPGQGKEWLRHYVVASTAPAATTEAIADLKTIWNELNPSYDFEYGFVDQELARLYLSEQRMGTLFNAFALLAIFISCLGLSGLAAFMAEQRTKEIGIRKVLGANITGIVSLFSKDFMRLVLLAIVIASPMAWYTMHRWLLDFAYRIDIGVWTFILAAGTVLLITLLTVGFQAIKAAITNPINSLRNE